jgi:predicted transcriptional regulator
MIIKPIEKEITHYLGHLNAQQKKVVLSVVKTLAQEEEEWWEETETAAKDSIEKGLQQAAKGKVTAHKEVMKNYKKWQSK